MQVTIEPMRTNAPPTKKSGSVLTSKAVSSVALPMVMILTIMATTLPFATAFSVQEQPNFFAVVGISKVYGLKRHSLKMVPTRPTTTRIRILGLLPSLLSASDKSDEEYAAEQPSEAETVVPQQQQPSRSPPRSTSRPATKTLDPLFIAVTRSDDDVEDGVRAKKSISVPILGELILDKSLFILLPVSGFAVGGVLLSAYILFHSGDAMVDAIMDNAIQQSSTSSIVPTNPGDGCRGLCSSQQQDLEGLKAFMSGIGK